MLYNNELSKCCHESAIENDNEDYVCQGCGKVCERVDFSDPDTLTDKELKMVKQWDREEREMWEDLEKAQFSN